MSIKCENMAERVPEFLGFSHGNVVRICKSRNLLAEGSRGKPKLRSSAAVFSCHRHIELPAWTVTYRLANPYHLQLAKI